MDELLTIADHVADQLDLSPGEANELRQKVPLLASLPFKQSNLGSQHKFLRRVGAPIVGFRKENKGRDFSKAGYDTTTIELAILDFSNAVDREVANGSPAGEEVVVARSILDHLLEAMKVFEKQIFDGSGGDADGFQGLSDAESLNNLDSEMVIDAGGTEADKASSVYLITYGSAEGSEGMSGLMPMGRGFENLGLGETIVQNMKDDEGKNFPAYYTPAGSHVGVEIKGKFSVARIANLTAEPGKGLNDDLLLKALENFDMNPDVICMNGRSRVQLRDSRTATNPTGQPAPIPTEIAGIPIL